MSVMPTLSFVLFYEDVKNIVEIRLTIFGFWSFMKGWIQKMSWFSGGVRSIKGNGAKRTLFNTTIIIAKHIFDHILILIVIIEPPLPHDQTDKGQTR